VTITLETVGPPAPPIDRYGRYILPGPDGKPAPHTRATTIAKTPSDTHALERWKMRMVAAGIGLRPDLYALASSHDVTEDRKTFDDITDKAMEAAGSSEKASLGTALHRFTERLDRGEINLDQIPDVFRERCALYLQRCAEHQIISTPDRCELRLIDDRYQIAGTCDRIVTSNDGTRISDLKTGGNLDYSWLEIAIQLAMYANHTATAHWNDRRNEWVRGPRIDVDLHQAFVVHLPSTGPVTCDIYQVDIGQGYAGYILAHEIREYRRTKNLATVYRPAGPQVTLEQWVRDRLAALTPDATTDLKRLWPLVDNDGNRRPLTNPTGEDIDLLASTLDVVEARHQIPFGPPRPDGKPAKTTRKNRK
jgi:hypothetical protein